MTYLKMKGQEASSWLKMVTRKMKIVSKILPDTGYNLSPPQARKKSFHLDGTLIWGLRPWNHLLAWGGLKCSTGVGVKKWPPGG